ncbi:uncharacterized protein LOC119982249 isoform X1 [Tripterygium wilfordii]|uniref:uncharacterized protein LOC119982249 isoform X1 n=1 Tax=Tripterygium wilfordii TaxID=458696 RepID=UPI0018F85E2C|nr:uncharacterized protein LOC119982249 isoform X1 [Tripterygium wilfordii]
MGEPVTAASQNTRTQIPIPTPSPNPAPTPTITPQPPRSNKRPLDSNVQIHDSSWYKMRAVVRDLRPHFVQVLQTPDFQNGKAAHDIQEEVKLLMELYLQLTAAKVSMAKCNGLSESQPLSGENGSAQNAEEHPQPDPDHVSMKPSENKSTDTGIVYEKQQHEAGSAKGTYMVGGSAFGWNFVTFTDSKPVYYGRTKESMRIAQANVVGISEPKSE